MKKPRLTLTILDGTFAICRMTKKASVPEWAQQNGFYSITQTADELSIVCPENRVPAGTMCEKGWQCLKVEGPLDFALTGILVSLATPLADAGISIFAISTYDTDYVLVKKAETEKAIFVLQDAGHRFLSESSE